MELKNIHNVYFIGIGGIGMSALASYFLHIGKNVAGYDKTASNITASLEEKGISIHYDDYIHNISKVFKKPKNTLVVTTPAIPKEHQELTYFTKERFTVMKRAAVLGDITKETLCMAVAGTHGKTTTSTILAYTLSEAGINATSFLGGISENYNTNFLYNGTDISVVEADEFDRSFLHLSPTIACITSMDADHLDVYKNSSELENSFNEFANCVSDQLIVRKGLPIEGITYGLDGENADYEAKNIRVIDGNYVFDIYNTDEVVTDISISLPGKHNVLNTLAALIMAKSVGVSLTKSKQLLQRFTGVKRRFSYQLKTKNKILIDDYAHHPAEINAISETVKELYPEKKTTVVFQPHLYSRTKDFADEFAKALAKFDALILLAIYPAREIPIEGITSEWLLEKVTITEKYISSKEHLFKNIQQTEAEVVIMLGAGDISNCVETIKTKWNEA